MRDLVYSTTHYQARDNFIRQFQADEQLQTQLGVGYSFLEEKIRAEVQALVKHGSLGKEYDINSIDRIYELQKRDIVQNYEQHAPVLVRLLRRVCDPLVESSEEPSSARIERVNIRISMILGILCYTQQPRNGDFFQSILGIHMHEQGAKKNFFSLMNHFGVTSSYDTVMDCINELHAKAKRQLQQIGAVGPIFALAYDNCELTINVNHASIDSQPKLHSITTGCIVPGRLYPHLGLKQTMLDTRAKLPYHKLVFAEGNIVGSPQHFAVTSGFGFQALQSLIPDISNVYQQSGIHHPAIQPLDQLAPDRQDVIALEPLDTPESTNQDHFRIQNEIFQQQLKIEEAAFEDKPLYLEYGDNKTTTRIRSIKAIAKSELKTYDKLDHILPIPGLFHMLYNLGLRLCKNFYQQDANPTFPCYLKWSQGKWARRHVALGGRIIFSHLQDFLIDNWNIRFLAELLNFLEMPHHYIGDQIQEFIRSLGPQRINAAIEEVTRRIEQYIAHGDKDIERRNHMLYLQQGRTFLLLKHAIKYGDIGHLRHAIDAVVLIFLGAGASNYTTELLFLQRCLHTEFCSEELQRAILATSFVNISGKPDAFHAVDEQVEFINKDVKEIWNIRHSPTTTLLNCAQQATLKAIYLRKLGTHLQGLFGRHRGATRPYPTRVGDIVLGTKEIRASVKGKGDAEVEKPHAAADLFYEGMRKLEKVRDISI